MMGRQIGSENVSNGSIQAGDVVQLKSGGPRMTVKWVTDGNAYCEWFDGKKQAGHPFGVVQLEKVESGAIGIS